MEQKTVTTVSPDNLRSSRPDVFLKTAVLKNSREFPGITRVGVLLIVKNKIILLKFSKVIHNSYSNISGWLLLWFVKCRKDISVHCFTSNL